MVNLASVEDCNEEEKLVLLVCRTSSLFDNLSATGQACEWKNERLVERVNHQRNCGCHKSPGSSLRRHVLLGEKSSYYDNQGDVIHLMRDKRMKGLEMLMKVNRMNFDLGFCLSLMHNKPSG